MASFDDKVKQICWELAEEYHQNQTRRDGVTPCITHIKRVERHCVCTITKCIAILHDIVEDTPMTLADLKQFGIPPVVVVGVDSMTKRKNESWDDYIKRLSENDYAIEVKVSDMLDNMTDKVSYNKQEKYKKTIIYLLNKLGRYDDRE